MLTLLVALLLLLAGCGGDDGDGDSGSGGEAAEAGGGDSGPVELTVVVGPVAFEHVYLADEQGFFAEQDIEVEIVTGGTADQQIPQLLSDEAQIVMTGGVAMITAASRDLPVSITLGALNATPPVTSGLVVPEDSPIQSTGDLEGTTVGLAGLQDTTQLGTMLSAEANGVDPESITFVEVPLPAMAESMEDGTIDAAYLFGPFYRVGEGTGYRLVESAAIEYLTDGPNVVFAASDQFIQENAGVVERFNAAIEEAAEFANSNEDEVRRIDAEQTEQPEEYIQARPLPPLATAVDRDATQVTIDAMAKFGFIDEAPDVGAVVSDLAPGP